MAGKLPFLLLLFVVVTAMKVATYKNKGKTFSHLLLRLKVQLQRDTVIF